MKQPGARGAVVSRWGGAVFVTIVAAACSQASHTWPPERTATTRTALSAGTTWFPVGPLGAQPQFNGTAGDSVANDSGFNQTGRAISITVNPQNANDVYLGTAGGGLWENPTLSVLQDTSKTPSKNPWSLVFSAANASSIGSVVADPTSCNSTRCGTLWVGTGEAGIRRETFFGNGLYKVTFTTQEVGASYQSLREPGSDTVTGGAIGSIVLAGSSAAQKVYFTVTGANAATGYDAAVFHPAPSAGFGVFLFDESTSTMTRESVPPGDTTTHNLPGGLALAKDSSNQSVLLAGFFNRGIYRKVLPSGSWCPVDPGTTVNGCPAPANNLPPNTSIPRFDHIALAASGSTVYATFADCSDRWSANGAGIPDSAPLCQSSVFVSHDAGQTWSAGATGLTTYSLYDHALAVSPLNPSEAYFGGYLARLSVDGGTSFPNFFPGVHPDIHAIFPSPHKFIPKGGVDDVHGTLHLAYIASDGGLSVANFDPMTPQAAGTVPVVQPPVFEIDRMGVLPCVAGQTCPTKVLAGTNDNGTILYNGGRLWTTVTGADVGDVVLIDQNSAVVSYYAPLPARIGTFGGVDDLSLSVGLSVSATDQDDTEYGKFAFTVNSLKSGPDGHGKVMLAPFIRDAVSHNFYYGTDRIYRGDPSSVVLTPISPRLLDNQGPCNRNNMTPQGNCPTGQFCVVGACRSYYTDIEKIDGVSSLASRNDQVYVGMYSGAFFKQAGSNFVQVTNVPTQRACSASALNVPPESAGKATWSTPLDPDALSVGNRCAPISAIDVNPFNTNQAYVTVGGFNNPGKHVWLYTNNGTSGSGDTWMPLFDGDLASNADQDITASAIRADPSVQGHVYLGTEVGLFERTATTQWAAVGSVPAVPVYDVVVDPALGRAYAGTHGRGVYMTVSNPLVHVFAGWMDPSKCPPNQPCIWDILVYGEGFQQPSLGGPTACTINILTPGGDVCAGGTVDAFSKNTIKVLQNGTIGQTVFNESDGKLTIAACFNGNCISGNGTTNISACEPDASHPNRTISAIQVQCPNNNQVVVQVPGNCPQLQSPPFADWNPSLTGDPPPSSAPPITAVTLALELDGMPEETLCSVTIPIFASDQHDDIVDRARAAFSASSICQAAGVEVLPKGGASGVEDLGATDILRMKAPNAIGRALYLAASSNPSTTGAPGLCQTFEGFPGYGTNQLDIMDTTFTTTPQGAAGGSVTFTEDSPLGRCSITVATSAGETASAIAQSVLSAYLAAYPTDSNPTCPYSANPGDLVATSPFVPLAPGTLNTIAATGLQVCINDVGVGVTVTPNNVPFFDASLNQAALFAATGTLTMKDNTQVTEPSGGFGLIANAGSGTTLLSPGVSVGQILSVGPVVLSDRDTVSGLIKSGGSITQGNSDTLGGPLVSSSAVTLPNLSQYLTTFPTQFSPGLTLQPGTTGALAPGAYLPTSIASRATLNLSTGTYFFTQIDLESQATVSLNDTAGPVVIYLRDSAILRGTFASILGGDPRLRIVYVGTATLQVSAPLSATVVAPNALLDLTPANGASYRGSFFGASVYAEAGNAIVHLPPQ